MTTTTTVRGDASDPKTGMTVGEIEAFATACREVGHPDGTRIRVTTGWRGQITRLETH